MASTLPQPLKWALLVAITGITGFGILTIGPKPHVEAEGRSPVIDVRSVDAEMNTAIARARGTLPTFWTSYDAPKSSETGHSLKVRFANSTNNGEHIWMADVKKIGSRPLFGQIRQRAALSARQARRRHGRVQGGRHLRLDVFAERQDRRRRDAAAVAEITVQARRRCAPRKAGDAVGEGGRRRQAAFFPSPLVGEGGFAKRRRVRGSLRGYRPLFLIQTPHPSPHFVRRHLLPQGEKEGQHGCRPGLGWYQPRPWPTNPKNPRN